MKSVFEELNALWESSSNKAYSAFMKVQNYINTLDGWEIVDCQQDDSTSMTLKCDVEYDIKDDAEAIADFANELGVDASVNLSGRNGYDVIIYLDYIG